MVGHFRRRTCCRMLLGCIEGLPIECRDTRRHRLALSAVSESERHPHSIGNGNFKLGQYAAAELRVTLQSAEQPRIPPLRAVIMDGDATPEPSEHCVYTHQMRMISVVLFLVASLFAESVAGLKWTMPTGWKTEGASPMRAATYTIAPAAGDTANAECVVYFFGAQQGGSVQANLDRWKGQMVAPGGKPSDAKIAKRTIHGLAVTTIDASGDYTGMGGPMAASKSVQKNYRLLGAIIEGPGGNVFIKFTGPAKTIAVSQAKFEQLLNSFEKEK